jgi:translation initiation factor IF-3
LDYGKFKYQQHKKEAEARRKQSITTVKELRLGYRTDVGDLERQIQKAREFLAEGDRVKFTLRFRGREMAYQDLGRQKLMRVCEALADTANVEGNPRMEGRMMGVILAPGVKKKVVKAASSPRPSVEKVDSEKVAVSAPSPSSAEPAS